MKLSAPPILQPPEGCQISYADWLQLIAYMESFSGMATALAQGVTNALPQSQPVTCVFGAGLSVAVGGTDNNNGCQFALCQGIMCASAGNPVGTQYNFTIPSNSTGSNRVDAIAIQPSTQQVSVVSRPVEQPGGSKPVQNIPVVINGLAMQYIEGPNGGGNPTIPAGWEKYAYVTVPNGAASLNDSDLTIFFPYMNATAFTVATQSIAVPAEGSSVTFGVNDTSVWQSGDYGYCVGPNSQNGFAFVIVSVDDNANTMTVTNVNTMIAGSGTMPIGAYLLAAGLAPVCVTTATTTVPVYGGTVQLYVSNASAFPAGSYGAAIGRVYGQSFYFYVNANNGTYLNVEVIGLGQGGYGLLSGAATIASGSFILPCVPPGIVEEDQDNGNILNPTMPIRVKKGTVTFASAGTSAITFFQHSSATVLPYTGANTYGISLTPDASAAAPVWFSAQAKTGFTIHASGAGDVQWTTVGY